MKFIRQYFIDIAKNSVFNLFFLCLLYFIFVSMVFANNDAETYIKGLRYPGGSNVRIHKGEEYNTFTMSYDVISPYPSKAVLEFYDLEFKKIGWVPFQEPYYRDNYRKWSCFENGTMEGDPLVHQLVAKWTNKKESRMVILGIRYYSYNLNGKGIRCEKNPNNDIQHVDLQIMPFVVLPPQGAAMPPSSLE